MSESNDLKIVGHCVTCGGPIYAQPSSSGGVPRNVYSCDCRSQQGKTTQNSKSGGMFKTGSRRILM